MALLLEVVSSQPKPCILPDGETTFQICEQYPSGGQWRECGWAVWSWDWVEKDVPWLVDSWKCWEVLWESRSQVNISLSDSLPRFYQNMFTFALSTFFFCFNSWLHFHLTCLLFQSKENIYKWRCLKMIHECPFIKKKKLVEFTDAYLLNMNSVAHK